MSYSNAFAWDKPHPKPLRGSDRLARDEKRAAEKMDEREAIAEAKKLANWTCRWPEPHKCIGGLEGAHVVDKSRGGSNVPENIFVTCAWIHRRGPESIHGKQLKVEIIDPHLGTKGPLSFWRRSDEYDVLGQPIFYEIARERSPFVLEKGEH